MTTLLERPAEYEANEPRSEGNSVPAQPRRRNVKRFRTWAASLVAVAVIATAAVGISLNQADATEALSFRAIGEAEALARFTPTIDAGLSYRAIGETEALARFAPIVDAGLSYRAIGEAEAIARFGPTVDFGLPYRAIGEAEALARFAPTVDAGLSYRSIGEAEAIQRFVPSS